MLVATEPSGDALGAGLAAALRRRLGEGVRFVGVGGAEMAAQGVVSPFDIRRLSIVGVFNAARAWPLVLRRARETAALAARERPDVAILIDAWGFTLRVAHRLRRLDRGLALIKYVAPQVWATRPGRARTLARAVDRLLTIHAFDSQFFEVEGLPVTFVGNPALGRDFSRTDPARLRAAIGAGPEDPILLILPGSRQGEIDRMLAPFAEAAASLAAERPGLRLVVAAADAVAAEVERRVAGWSHRACVVQGETARLDAMRAATAALACSGTVTTELALAGCPMIVAYRLGALTHAVAKRLIRTPYITLLNVAARAFVAPELVQGDCNGPALARAAGRLLDDPALRGRQVAAQNAALHIMRGGIEDPTGRAAEAVIEELRKRGRI
ncbi:MAG: lipid-A-disaccharide synthase [Caulobacteraceae bacterium]|nr:lipid-A-disaccharide synthase [Caulobacteraceae bacterium]